MELCCRGGRRQDGAFQPWDARVVRVYLVYLHVSVTVSVCPSSSLYDSPDNSCLRVSPDV